MSRIEPATPPYTDEVAERLEMMMPPGVPPIGLFRTFVRNLPMATAMGTWGGYELSKRLSLTMRDREIVIDRTCARCHCEYEWGVHIAFFAERAKLTPEQVQATARGRADDAVWTDEERLLLGLVNELCDTATVSDALWEQLSAAFTVDQMLEAILLVGFYHSVSFLANALKLAPEPYAAPFPSAG
jgi:alkylhydroperoxidase family enzyme